MSQVDLTRIREVTQLHGLVGNTTIESVRTRLIRGIERYGPTPLMPGTKKRIKRLFWRMPFCRLLEMIILPRQARDKHRKSRDK